MSLDGNSTSGEVAQGSISASPFAQAIPPSHRTQRSRRVCVGSTDENWHSTMSPLSNRSSNNNSIVGGPYSPHMLQRDFSPMLGSPIAAIASVGLSSLLIPPSRAPSERSAAALRAQQQQQQREVEEEAFLNALSSGKGAQTSSEVIEVDLKPKWELRSAASTVKRLASLRNIAQADRSRASQSCSSLFAMGAGGGCCSNPLAASSPPASFLRPESGFGGTVAEFATTSPGCGAVTAATATVAATAAPAKRASDTPKRVASPTSSSPTTAGLFPTTEWIRTALGRGGGNGAPVDGDGLVPTVGGRCPGLALKQGMNDHATLPESAAAVALTSPNGTAPPPPHDAAVRLHEQRMNAVMRSQDAMREFNVILRRLEEHGAQVLRGQRRGRLDRHTSQGGSPVCRQSRQRPDNARGSESGVRFGGDAEALEGSFEHTDVEQDDGAVEPDAMFTVNQELAAGDLLGRGSRLSAAAAAEVQGAESMSRVALLKLRDRTAREWVLLQRQRLEQRRGGPTALQRHIHASRARLQATRTRGGARGNRARPPQQRLLSHAHNQNSASVPAQTASDSRVAKGESEFQPSLHTGLSLHSLTGSALAISWGGRNTPSPDNGAGMTDAKESEGRADPEGQLGAGGAYSVTPAEAGVTQDGHPPDPEDDSSSAPLDGLCDSADAPVRTPQGLLPELAMQADSESKELPTTEKGDARTSSLLSPSCMSPQSEDAYATTVCAVDLLSPDAAPTTTAVATTPDTAAANSQLEDDRLRRELQRLLRQANECMLYGLDQCLNSRASAPPSARPHQGPTRVPPAAAASSSPPKSFALEASNAAWSRSSSAAPRSLPSQRSVWTPQGADHRDASLPTPLHQTLGTYSFIAPPSASIGKRGHSANRLRIAAAAAAAAATTTTSSAMVTARTEAAETLCLSQTSVTETNGVDNSMTLTPSNVPSFPPLHPTPSATSTLPPACQNTNYRTHTPDTKLTLSKQSASSLPSVNTSRRAARTSVNKKPNAPPPRRRTSFIRRRKHQRTPLPVEHGVGEHAAVLLHYEILLTRRSEMEAERGHAQEIDRACETLQQLLPLREQLLDQDIQCGNNISKSARAAGQLPTLKGSAQPIGSAPSTPQGDASDGAPRHGGRQGKTDAAADRSSHHLVVLQRHRQLLYDEAVRMASSSRYASRNAYLDVLSELARRHVSSVSWPMVEGMLEDAREQLWQEAEGVAPSTGGATGCSGRVRASPERSLTSLSPRDKLHHLIVAHLGVLELSQWQVQEVLQHLAALYRVPLHVLHESIAEQQRRFAHAYNYEERFRAVDRTLAGGGGGADCMLRWTLHLCRRPPLAPLRDGVTSNSNAAASKAPSAANSGRIAAAAQAMGMPRVDPHGEALYFIRLRVGQQSVSSSAVPLSSAAAGLAGGDSSAYASVGRSGAEAGGASTQDVEDESTGATQLANAKGSGGRPTASSPASSAKQLSFLGQALTIYLSPSDATSRKRRVGMGAGARAYRHPSSQSPNNNFCNSGDGGLEDEGGVMTVELMQTGVEAPLARGEVDLTAIDLTGHGESARARPQNVQIPLRRKGYRTAMLHTALEVTY